MSADRQDSHEGFDELADALLAAFAGRSTLDALEQGLEPPGRLTPRAVLVAGLVYLSGADGNLDDNEIGDLLRVVPDRTTLVAALDYCKHHDVETFLQTAAELLSPEQKRCLMLNAIDLALGDGNLDGAEHEMLLHYAQALELPEHELQPHVRTFMLKNDLSVFE